MRRRPSVRPALLLAAAALALTGCWDRKELNELAISVGMGFDQAGENGELVRVTTQIVNPGEVASGNKGSLYTTPVTTLSKTDATTFEAMRKLSTESPREIFSSHLRVLVIGEELARQGIKNILDGVSRDHEFRSDFYILIARGTTAQRILKVLTPIEKIPSNKLYASLNMAEKVWAPAVKMQLTQLISCLSDPSKATVLTSIEVKGDAQAGERMDNVSEVTPPARLQYNGLGILKDGRLIDWMDQEESKGYNYIMGKVKNSAGHIRCMDGGVLSVEVERTRTRVKGKVVDGQPRIVVDLYSEEGIAEVRCKTDLTKPKNIEMLEQIADEKLTDILTGAIRKAQKNEADIFGFGEAIEEANPRYWQRIKPKWPSYFAEMDVEVHVNTQLRRFGTTSNAIITKKEK